jgi:hypothetical protein
MCSGVGATERHTDGFPIPRFLWAAADTLVEAVIIDHVFYTIDFPPDADAEGVGSPVASPCEYVTQANNSVTRTTNTANTSTNGLHILPFIVSPQSEVSFLVPVKQEFTWFDRYHPARHSSGRMLIRPEQLLFKVAGCTPRDYLNWK